jgi:hypothetical protein
MYKNVLQSHLHGKPEVTAIVVKLKSAARAASVFSRQKQRRSALLFAIVELEIELQILVLGKGGLDVHSGVRGDRHKVRELCKLRSAR